MIEAEPIRGPFEDNAKDRLDFTNFHADSANELENELRATESLEARQALARRYAARLEELVKALKKSGNSVIDRNRFTGLLEEICSNIPTSGEAAIRSIALSTLITKLSDVKIDRWEYLFEHRIAFGCLTMLFGEPGLGKSALIANLVAKLSLGHELPDGRRQEPMTTLLMTREDDPSKTLRPRYEFVGADMDKVIIWHQAPCLDGKLRPPNIVDHLETLERLVHSYGVRFLMVDPLTTFLPAHVDINKKPQAVADALNDLAELVRRLDIACVLLAHPPKGAKGNAIDRIFGTVTIGGTIRSALELRKDPEDEDSLLLVGVKMNIGPPCNGLRLRIAAEHIEAPDGGPPISVSSVEWTDTLIGVTARSLDNAAEEFKKENAQAPRTEKAVKFLEAQLCGALCPATAIASDELIAKGKNAGISRNAIFAAKKCLGVQSTPKTFAGGVSWYIPEPGDDPVL